MTAADDGPSFAVDAAPNKEAATPVPRPFVIERVAPPTWIASQPHDASDALYDALGEQAEWGFAIPWVFRALASPFAHEPILQAPRSGEDFWPGALAYWSSLLHLLVYTFGWVRPDRGLRWWYDAGKPLDDLRFQLISQVWDADGQLDWFAAWLWSSPWAIENELFQGVTGYRHDGLRPSVEDRWIETQRADAQSSSIPAPISDGGTEPLHLPGHIDGPLQEVGGRTRLFQTKPTERRAVLLLDSMMGWYRALAAAGESLPSLSTRSWRVDVVVRPVGSLGTYRRSRATGLWFMGRHRLHMQGV